MNGRPDLLVLGGGPAGSAMATLAAASGARVLLVEKARFPRDKVCGEFISAEGVAVLRRLGILDELVAAGATRLGACRLTDRKGSPLDAALPELPGGGREALGISRSHLDEAMLALAERRGAVVRRRWEALEPVLENGRVAGCRLRAVGSGDRGETVHAGQVVAADGRRSILARRFHPELCDPQRIGPRSWFGIKTHLTTSPGRLDHRVELHLFDGGYAGLAEIEGRRLNLCCLVTVDALRGCGGSPQRVLDERVLHNAAAREAIGDGRRCAPWKAVGPLRFGPRRATAAGAILVGDAAGTIDPFCGEGISNALAGAELALPIALRAAGQGGLDGELAREYAASWNRAFGAVTRRVRGLGRLLERPGLAGAGLWLLRGAARGLAPRLVAMTRTGA